MATRWTSKHTGQKIDDTIDGVCNPNLLDNWYFVNPVNQRGQTKYAVSGYTIDRWKSGEASDVVKVENGVLSISMTALYQTFSQNIENPERYSGKTLTVSVLIDSVDANDAYQLVVRIGTQLGQYATKLVTGSGLFSTKWKVPDGCTLLQVVIQSVKANAGNISIKAAKLELGSQQTLAHQESGNWVLNEIPDYGEQLRRCQRYSVHGVGPRCSGYAINGSDRATIFIPTPVTMRTIASAEIVTTDNLVTSYGDIIPIKSFSPATTLPNGVVGNLQINSPVTQNCVVAASGFKCNLIADL